MSIYTQVQDKLAEQTKANAEKCMALQHVFSNFATWFESTTAWPNVQYAKHGEEQWGERSDHKLSSTKNPEVHYECKIRVRLPIERDFLETELVVDDEKVVRFLGKDIGKKAAELTPQDAEQFGELIYQQIVAKRMTPA